MKIILSIIVLLCLLIFYLLFMTKDNISEDIKETITALVFFIFIVVICKLFGQDIIPSNLYLLY